MKGDRPLLHTSSHLAAQSRRATGTP
jgi:hypothetical protein